MSIIIEQPSLPMSAPAREPATPDGARMEAAPIEHPPFTISKRTHLMILIGCAIVVGLAMSMSIGDGRDKVSLPGMTSPMPEMCHLKRTFHIPCPGCGLTRSFISMGHFDIPAAASFNVVGIPLFLLTLAQIPYRAYWLLRRDRKAMSFVSLRVEGALMIGMSMLLVVQWLVRMAL
jgi:Protein of unknown function (DUF2752)